MLLTDLLLFPLKIDILPRRWNLQRLGKLFPGGLEGIRTLDPHNANVVRSQLSYKPISRSMLL